MKKAWKVIKTIGIILLVILIVFTFGSCCNACSEKTGVSLPSWFPSWNGLFDLFNKKVEAPDPDKPDDDGDHESNISDNERKYIVTFRYNYTDAPTDGIYAVRENVAHGSVLDLSGLEFPLRGGYEFVEWTLDAAGENVYQNSEIVSDTELFAQWQSVTYTVTFNANGGILTGAETMQTNEVGKLDAFPSVTRDGFRFEGWHIKNADDSETKVSLNKTYFEDSTLYAKWRALGIYTITFDSNGGVLSGAATMQTDKNGKLEQPPTVTLSNYYYAFWSTKKDPVEITVKTVLDEDGKEHNVLDLDGFENAEIIYVLDNHVFTSDMTLYAHFKATPNGDDGDNEGGGNQDPKPDIYTVTFDANEGTLTGAETMQTNSDGRLEELPTVPEREGYSFVGWFTAVDGGYAVTTEYVFYKDATVYAHWIADNGDNEGGGNQDPNPKIYTVTFDANEGTLTGAETMQTNSDGRLSGLPTNPTRAEYLFLGWFTATTAGSQVTVNTVFTEDITVYARWKKATVYMITFDSNGGYFSNSGSASPVQIQTDAYGRLTQMPSVTRANYNFQDWYWAGHDSVTYSTVFTANATVIARWTEKSYAVDFNMNGGMVYDSYGNKYDYVVSCVTGDGFKVVNPPSESYISRDNFVFVGWYTDRTDGRFVDIYSEGFRSNTTLYARWQFDDSSFGSFGDRASAASVGRYAFTWAPDKPDTVSNNQFEAKLIIVFDSPTTYNDFNVNVSATSDYSTVSFEITPMNFARFTVDTLTFDYPSISFGFANPTYDISDNGGAIGSFEVSDTFYTDGDCYVIVWVYTSLINYPDDSLATEILSRINCNSSNYVATYKGFTFSDNFVVYIHTTSPDYAISEVEFVSGSAPSVSDVNSNNSSTGNSGDSNESGSSGSESSGTGDPSGGVVVYGLDYSRLLGGSYGFPIRYLIDESGYIIDFTINITVKPMTDIPNPDANKIDGSVTVDTAVDIQYLCYYNFSDGIVSFEYFGDLTDYYIGIYCPDTGATLPVLRHYTYECGGSVMFEWDGADTITVKIFGFVCDSDITSDTTFDDPDSVLDNLTEYFVVIDSTNELIYFIYSGYIGDYEVRIFNSDYNEYRSHISSGVFGEEHEYSGYSYLVFDCKSCDYSFKIQQKV